MLCSHSSYRRVCNLRRTLEGNTIVDHSDVVGASPVGAAHQVVLLRMKNYSCSISGVAWKSTLHVKILIKLVKVSDENDTCHPMTWLTQ